MGENNFKKTENISIIGKYLFHVVFFICTIYICIDGYIKYSNGWFVVMLLAFIIISPISYIDWVGYKLEASKNFIKIKVIGLPKEYLINANEIRNIIAYEGSVNILWYGSNFGFFPIFRKGWVKIIAKPRQQAIIIETEGIKYLLSCSNAVSTVNTLKAIYNIGYSKFESPLWMKKRL
ncbi:MAG: hypothetical protein NTY09_04860 [bacterium]|nr:hypothetical protein [bacterium]